jgi:hypothetical protein
MTERGPVPEQGTGPRIDPPAGAGVGSNATGPRLQPARQLSFSDQNHPTVQARQRAVAAAVLAGTYRGRDGRSHPFQARHQLIMWWFCALANTRGEVIPQVMTVNRLADELGRDRSGVRRDVRELEAAGILWRRSLPGTRGLFTYWIPGMQAPLRSVD